MKKILITSALALIAVGGFAQGTMVFGNLFFGDFVAPIFGPDPLNPFLSLHGQPLPGSVNAAGAPIVPAGTVVYSGSLLQGTGFTLQVWTGDSPIDIAPVFTTSFRTAAGNKLPAGLMTGQQLVSFANLLGGSRGFYDVRAWDNRGGTVTSWADALVTALVGESGIVQSGPLGGVDASGNLYPVPPRSMDWASFNIHYIVPEPAALALAGLGAAVLLLRRRRN